MENLKANDNQVGGHHKNQVGPGSYVDAQGRFYKPIQGGGRSDREVDFYKLVFAPDASEDCKALIKFLPPFHGTQEHDGNSFLVLGDSCNGYKRPCSMDCKVGFRTWHPSESPEQIAKCKVKDVEGTQHTDGFRMCGSRVWQVKAGEFKKGDRLFGKSLTSETLPTAFTMFADNEALSPSDLYGGENGLLAQLKELLAWAETQTEFDMCASSVLLTYEGEATTGSEINAKVQLIDFAHTFQCGENDKNLATGLRSLVSVIEKVL